MKKVLFTTAAMLVVSSAAHANITKEQVIDAQTQWAQGIEKISKTYVDKGDYNKAAKDHINDLYAYDMGPVLFKPTLAAEDQFRENLEQAHSYFVGGIIEEDKGFAIKPWKKVRFGEQEIITGENYAVAMGNYYFTPMDGDEEQKVEYTFKYVPDAEGNLKINVHHSSLPFSAE